MGNNNNININVNNKNHMNIVETLCYELTYDIKEIILFYHIIRWIKINYKRIMISWYYYLIYYLLNIYIYI